MDLISRQAAIDALNGNITVTGEANAKAVQEYIRSVSLKIKDLPSAQKTGRWETAMLDHEAFGVRPKVLYCSDCHQCIAYPTRYCPNCGAKMDNRSTDDKVADLPMEAYYDKNWKGEDKP